MRYLLITVLGLTIFAACKKVESVDSREEEMRNGRWQRSDLTMKYDPALGQDKTIAYYKDVMPDCKKDNFIIFGMNHEANLHSGDIKCDNVPDPDAVPFYWSIEENDARITIYGADDMFFDSSIIDAKFEQYSKNKFLISYVEFHPNPINSTKKDTLTYFYTFTKF